MSTPTNEQPYQLPENLATPEADELTDKQLDEASGGLNPQPEPPGRHRVA